MIVTVTPNPAIDRTLTVSALRRGAVMRSLRTTSEPSGKGVNVSIALQVNGHRTRAVLPVGGPDGIRLVTMLDAHHLDHVDVPIEQEVRCNVSLVEPDGTVTKVNEPGPTLSAAELDALVTAARSDDAEITWLVGCGSLPAGVPDDFYARLVVHGHLRAAKVAIDSSGAPLAAALPAAPDLVKPNADELAEVTGMPVTTVGEAVAAARRVQDMGAASVLASLGADGALLVEDDVVHGAAVVDQVRNSVGTGDALLAGFLAGGGRGTAALGSALAFAAAALRQPGTLMPGPDEVARSRVHIHERVDLGRRLRDA